MSGWKRKHRENRLYAWQQLHQLAKVCRAKGYQASVTTSPSRSMYLNVLPGGIKGAATSPWSGNAVYRIRVSDHPSHVRVSAAHSWDLHLGDNLRTAFVGIARELEKRIAELEARE